MILWLVLTAMTSFAAVLVAAPFLRDWDRRPEGHAQNIFKEQLREVERERARGEIDGAAAQAAAVEIQRRLLAARTKGDAPALSAKERAFAAIGVAGVVALGAVGLFAITSGQAPASQSEAAIPQASGEAGTPPVDEMIRRLAQRLQNDPRDATGWRTLGWAKLQTDAYAEAAEAYARAIELQPEAADNYSARAEALIKAARDEVTEPAQAALDAALARDPKDARARYWAGVARQQNGDKDGAGDIFRALLAEGAEADFATEIKRRIAGLDGSAPPQAQTDPSAMIHAMVDRLEQRLASAPQDQEGWIRLVKSRMTLGEKDKARGAYERALLAFAAAPDARRRIEDAAKEAGL